MHALKKLSLQNNRLENLNGLQELISLEELYISCNGIQIIEGLNNLINLKILDLANNRIKKLEGIKNLSKLTDLWLDSNQIDQKFEEIEEEVAGNVQNSVTVLYMDDNPISKNQEEYQIKITQFYILLNMLNFKTVRFLIDIKFKSSKHYQANNWNIYFSKQNVTKNPV
eukprot:TRINITY_DN8702_c0_g1_i2.p1 TRINITY_DN8702_c0_g1~~TRINITY_DN8702_c0_g1_i2.p1  ORF type:complete len:169 (+),score=29.21 TRINITY_DN8702_c0_g1_i2:475-981(+)